MTSLLVLVLAGVGHAVAFPTKPLQTLNPAHPRLIARDKDVARIRKLVQHDPTARAWYHALRKEGVALLGVPPPAYDAPSMHAVGHQTVRRIYTLGLLYRLDGDVRFARRARDELLAVAAFADWNPSHFLDTAELCHAVAVGYDWLYPWLSPDDRRTLRQAMVRQALLPALALYRTKSGWTSVTHNWNLVCNGGVALGALAIAEDEPKLCAEIVGDAVQSARRAMVGYAPQGAWNEGPGYWDYATRYAVHMIAGLQSALRTDFGLSAASGFADTGLFKLAFTGPTGRVFNFADGDESGRRSPALLWLAARFHRPLYAWMERHAPFMPRAEDLLWYTEKSRGPHQSGTSTRAIFHGVEVAFMRTRWDDARATWIGIKGGSNQVHHGHLDLGTFVMEADGVRWAVELPADNYNLPGYFDAAQRYRYYRASTDGHNTLSVLPEATRHARPPGAAAFNQLTTAFARVSARGASGVSVDLTEAWPAARRVRRSIALERGGDVTITDEVAAWRPVQVIWRMHTAAHVTLRGRVAELQQDGRRVYATLQGPRGAKFECAPAAPLQGLPVQGEAINRGIRKLIVRVDDVRSLRLRVRLSRRRVHG